MSIQSSHEEGLRAAAAEIERKVRELAVRHGKRVDRCSWVYGQPSTRCDTYRLDILVGDRVVKVYFTEHELDAYWESGSGGNTDIRLGCLMSGLDAPDA
jgi:hypothetical protein